MSVLIDLGYCVGKLEGNTKLIICSPSSAIDETFYPSESVIIYGHENIKTLRDALIKAIPLDEKS